MFEFIVAHPSSAGVTPEIQSGAVTKDTGTAVHLMGTFADKALAGRLIQPENVLIRQLDENLHVLRPIPVKIRRTDGSFIASFNAANAHASGDTWSEALNNLEYWLIDLFNNLITHKPEKLGPAPKRQLAVLQSYLGMQDAIE